MNYLLGIDGSTVNTGWCIRDKDTLEFIDGAEIIIDSKQESCMRARVGYMIKEIEKIIDKYKPNEIIMEDVIPAINNGATVLALGILSGGVMGLANSRNIVISYVLPNIWQSALGFKKSNGDLKKQSIDFVNNKFNKNYNYVSPSSKKNQDNLTDSVCITCWKLNDYKYKKFFGRR